MAQTQISKRWVAAIVALFILLFVGSGIFAYATEEQVRFKVTKVERVQKSESGYYLIFTDRGVYKNSDSLWYMKFDSSDLYARLDTGQMDGTQINATVDGWRVPFLSMYPNIVEAQPCE